MPALDLTIPETNDTVIRAVAQQTVGYLLKSLGLKTYFKDDDIAIRSDVYTDSKTSDSDGRLRLDSDKKCVVNFTTVTNPNQVRWNFAGFDNVMAYGLGHRDRDGTMALFSDPRAGVQVYEVCTPINLKFVFNLTVADKAEAQRIESMITARHRGDSVPEFHDYQYHYPLSKDLASVMMALYKLRDFDEETGYIDYLKAHCSADMTKVTDRYNNENTRMVFVRSSLGSEGVLEYDQERPEPIQSAGRLSAEWMIEFTYTVQFNRPSYHHVRFPVVIDNKLIPSTLVAPQNEYSTAALTEVSGIFRTKVFNRAIRHFTASVPYVARFPYYDDFEPSSTALPVTSGFRPFFNMAITLEDEGPTEIPLVDEDYAVRLTDTTIEIMKAHGNDILWVNGLFNVAVYVNGTQLDNEYVSIDEDLVVTITAERKDVRYHVIVSETMSLNRVEGKYVRLLMQYRWYFAMTIAKNLNYLIDLGHYKVAAPSRFEIMLQKMLRDGSISTHLDALIAAEHATAEIYEVTWSSYQFMDYILTHVSPTSGRFVYQELVDRLQSEGVLLTNVTDVELRTRHDLPFHTEAKDLGYACITPFRFLTARISR
jgi:hypothetical protein